MSPRILLATSLMALVVAAAAHGDGRATGRDLPIVLVHGFAGWGRDELGTYRYWGGTALDIQDYLRSQGFSVHTGSMGPISSNHDRACELFAHIRGGRVDYGEIHSRTFGHARFGRDYGTGLHPGWDAAHPIHLVGHSMGGQTSRLLTHMIATDRFGVGSDVSWIRSCSAISTPHDGTTLATILDSLLGAGGMERALVAMLPGRTTTDRSVYDFDLWHWGLEPRPGEGVKEFVRRVYRTLAKTKDLSSWDLTPQGARELNERVPVYPTVTYLTWANEETVRLPITGRHVSSVEMNPVFWAFGDLMGNYSGSAVSRPTDWWENDGVVNTVSMKGPSGARIVTHVPGEPLARGAFNFMGLSSGKDHLKMVGHYQDPFLWGRWLRRFYLDLARQLAGL